MRLPDKTSDEQSGATMGLTVWLSCIGVRPAGVRAAPPGWSNRSGYGPAASIVLATLVRV